MQKIAVDFFILAKTFHFTHKNGSDGTDLERIPQSFISTIFMTEHIIIWFSHFYYYFATDNFLDISVLVVLSTVLNGHIVVIVCITISFSHIFFSNMKKLWPLT